MEYASDGDLYSHVEKNGPLTEARARKILRQILSALEYCLLKGWVHHDVKLENILLMEEDDIRLSDFGLSQRLPPPPPLPPSSLQHQVHEGEERRSLLNVFSGSPLYMAPEIFSLQEHDEQVDMWSLGVCLYFMLVGSFPFIADSYPALEESVLFDDVKFTTSMNLSSSVQDLIRLMLSKDPKKRIKFLSVRHHKWLNEDIRPQWLYHH
eukprot:TRINITY_DN196_c0_g1_i5.p1 TRINITY_DN196_c0_g1~~TRINITY_DN196_c0_g1_i5.p1  ORF type:complete len:209 (+),score=44.49 TRINITY_DN196_c0_g1_i5:414-1040(+)